MTTMAESPIEAWATRPTAFEWGGKAATLLELQAAGFRVPDVCCFANANP